MATTDRGIASLQSFAIIARVAIWVFLLALLLCAIPTLAVLARDAHLADPPLWVIPLAALGGLLYLAAFLLALIPLALWIHRAHANLLKGGLAGLAYTPGWALGSFFVPLVNFVVPLRAMRELHNRSLGGLPEWSQSSVGSVSSWWACHIAAVLVWGFLMINTLLPVLTNAMFTTPPAATDGLTLLLLMLLAGSAWFLMQIIREVTEAQAQGTFAAGAFA